MGPGVGMDVLDVIERPLMSEVAPGQCLLDVPKSEALPVHNRALSKNKLFLPSSIVNVNTNINPA